MELGWHQVLYGCMIEASRLTTVEFGLTAQSLRWDLESTSAKFLLPESDAFNLSRSFRDSHNDEIRP